MSLNLCEEVEVLLPEAFDDDEPTPEERKRLLDGRETPDRNEGVGSGTPLAPGAGEVPVDEDTTHIGAEPGSGADLRRGVRARGRRDPGGAVEPPGTIDEAFENHGLDARYAETTPDADTLRREAKDLAGSTRGTVMLYREEDGVMTHHHVEGRKTVVMDPPPRPSKRSTG